MSIQLKFILFVILIFNTSIVLGSDNTHVNDGKSIDIKDDSGQVFGALKEGNNGKSLFLIVSGKEPIEIGSCSEDIISEIQTPDSSSKAVVLVKNCGATVDFATHIIFESKSNTEVIAVYSGSPTVNIKWIDNAHLSIERSALTPADIFKELSNIQGVTVTMSIKSKRSEMKNQDKLNFASMNYGATGLAAGMPKELLLRWAGWSQKASGLYRPEWGTWNGSEPYGDDPAGHKKVLEGMDYYLNKYGDN